MSLKDGIFFRLPIAATAALLSSIWRPIRFRSSLVTCTIQLSLVAILKVVVMEVESCDNLDTSWYKHIVKELGEAGLTMSIWLMKCSGFLRWPWANTCRATLSMLKTYDDYLAK